MPKAIQLQRLRQFLEEHPREAMVEWLLAAAKDLPDFRQRLELYLSTHQEAAQLVENAKDGVLRLQKFVTQSRTLKTNDVTPTLQFLVQVFAAALDHGHAAEMLVLIENSIVNLDRVIYGMQKTLLKWTTIQRELETLHLRCVMELGMQGPDLARRIFKLQCSTYADVFLEAPTNYAEAMGKSGLQLYRELLEPAYRTLVMGEAHPDRTISGLRGFLRQRAMLGAWATHSGSLEERLEVLVALSLSPQEILNAAKELEAKGFVLEALQTVKKGYERFEARNPHPLALYLAERHESFGQFEEALQYRWRIYTHNPTLDHYRKMMATAAPARQTERYLEGALDVASQKSNSLYAQLLLEQGRVEDALEVARSGGAAAATWASLAACHAEIDPSKAIEIYFHCVATSLMTSPNTTSNYLTEAWKLAMDANTFQVFRNCLKNLASKHHVMPSIWKSAEAAGVPVARLLS